MVGLEVSHIDVLANVGVGNEFDSFLAQEIDSSFYGFLLELHVGDSVHEEASDAVGTFVDRHLVSHLVELVGGGQSGGSRSDHCDGHAGAFGGDAGDNESLLPGPVDNGVLNVLNRHGAVHQPRHTGSLARRRTDPSSELRKVVGFVQPIDGFLPLVLVHEVVPLRNEVVDRTTRVCLAKGCATIHTTSRLDLTLHRCVLVGVTLRGIQLSPIHNPLQRRTVRLRISFVIDKPT